MTNFIAGTIAKFPELEITNFKWFAIGQFGSHDAIQAVLDKADSYPDPPESEKGRPLECLWEDILTATGLSTGKEFDRMMDGETFMSVEAIKIISRVWESPSADEDGGYPLREVIAMMESHGK